MLARMFHVRPSRPEELPALLELRVQVFVHEQGVPFDEEHDAHDAICQHFGAWEGGELVGTARLREVAGEAKAERVAVAQARRGQGVGAALMAALEAEAARRGLPSVKLAAQLSAVPFYTRLGYVAWGEVFLDAGIEHRWMRKSLGG